MEDTIQYGTEHRTDIPTATEVVAKFRDRVEGKIFVVTGTSLGSIGAETVKALASSSEKPSRVFLLARSEAKVSPVMEEIGKVNSSLQTTFVKIDLMDRSSIRRAAAEILASTDKIDYLMNFAGVFVRPDYIQSEAGIEQHFMTNHLGHFLLTNLLMPALLKAGKGARIAQLSSRGYTIRPFELDNYNFQEGKTYHPWEAYSQADSACILFARELARRLQTHGHHSLRVFSVNPGFVPDSNLNNHLPPDHMQGALAKYLEFHTSVPEDVEEGVLTLQQGPSSPLFAALDPDLDDGQNGLYVEECKVVSDEKMTDKWAIDDELARQLWELDEKLVGESFL